MARIHTKSVARATVLIIIEKLFRNSDLPVKINEVRRHIIKIFAYSAINNNANIPLLYSVLNPDTSSDSPSARSKGVRFVSARFVINHIKNSGSMSIEIHENMWVAMACKSISAINIKALIKISAIDTSYEMVWATPRSAPSKAYFEFEHHPDMNVT